MASRSLSRILTAGAAAAGASLSGVSFAPKSATWVMPAVIARQEPATVIMVGEVVSVASFAKVSISGATSMASSAARSAIRAPATVSTHASTSTGGGGRWGWGIGWWGGGVVEWWGGRAMGLLTLPALPTPPHRHRRFRVEES